MTTPDAGSTVLTSGAGKLGAEAGGQPVRPTEPPIPNNDKSKNIHVSPAVLDAARKSSEELFQDLRTAPVGLTQAEAEERARMTGQLGSGRSHPAPETEGRSAGSLNAWTIQRRETISTARLVKNQTGPIEIKVRKSLSPKVSGTMNRSKIKTLILMCGCLVLSGCTSQPVPEGAELPGFLSGIFHGFFILFAMVGHLFDHSIRIYTFPNNGGWYDFGFIFGIGFWISAGTGARRNQGSE